MAPQYVSNENESVRLFRSDVAERLSHMHPSTPLWVGVPIVAFMTYLGFWRFGLPAASFVVWTAAGVAAWTLLEYTLHRFAFHHRPRTRIGQKLHYYLHGIHHDYPQDASRLVMPPPITVPAAVVFYGLLWLAAGTRAPAILAGIVVGYVAYDLVHYATHHLPMRGPVGRRLKRYHLRHHYKDPDRGFGVSTPVWDYVLGTRFR